MNFNLAFNWNVYLFLYQRYLKIYEEIARNSIFRLHGGGNLKDIIEYVSKTITTFRLSRTLAYYGSFIYYRHQYRRYRSGTRDE